MEVLRSITSITLRDRQTNETIKEQCKTQNVNKWIKTRKENWNENVIPEILVNICRNNKSYRRRLP